MPNSKAKILHQNPVRPFQREVEENLTHLKGQHEVTIAPITNGY